MPDLPRADEKRVEGLILCPTCGSDRPAFSPIGYMRQYGTCPDPFHANPKPEDDPMTTEPRIDPYGENVERIQNAAYNLHTRSGDAIREHEEALLEAGRDYALAEAWIGLQSLLRGAWGSKNVEALGGGALAIERAFAVLSDLIDRRGLDG